MEDRECCGPQNEIQGLCLEGAWIYYGGQSIPHSYSRRVMFVFSFCGCLQSLLEGVRLSLVALLRLSKGPEVIRNHSGF